MEVLVFGGTAEGRQLVEWLSSLDCCDVVSCAATEYGGELVSGLPRVTPHVGPLDEDGKERLVQEHDFACIVDATHPYATHVTASVLALAEMHAIPHLRLLREGGYGEDFTSVPDVESCAQLLAERPGRVLLTTGAKDLPAFVAAVPDFAQRLYARILPVGDSVERARNLGIPASHIIAMQGPFTREFNEALMRQLGIDIMVTKASGKTGGFEEKVDAARACGAELVVIDRPSEEGGFSFAEVQEKLSGILGISSAAVAKGAAQDERIASGGASAPEAALRPTEDDASDRTVYLVGIGLGNPDTMTYEARVAIERSDLLIGARRMLEPYADKPCSKLALIKSDDIARALCESDAQVASVLFSGDVGFYSGAATLSKKLAQLPEWDVRAIPGISSVVCLCARLLTPWQDVHLVSAHGRECDPVAEVRAFAKTFMLTGGQTKARDICRMLDNAGMGSLTVHVGERLSYPDERITSGMASELAKCEFDDLAVMLVENPAGAKLEPGKLTD